MQIVFSLAFCLGQTKPADYGELEYDNVAHDSHETKSISESNDGTIYDTGIFTKYPESPTDEEYEPLSLRQKRNVTTSSSEEAIDALDVNQLFFNKVYNMSRPQRQSDAKKDEKIPLNGLISAIETELVDSADKINGDVTNPKRRSAPENTEKPPTETEKSPTETEKPPTETEKPIDTDDDDTIDVNKNFFDGIFEFTRAQRDTVNQNVTKTFALKGLVDAVESTLFNSARKLQTNTTKASNLESVDKIPADAEPIPRKTRNTGHDSNEEEEGKEEGGGSGRAHYDVKKVSPTENSNLDILKPITFKTPTSESTESNESNETEEMSTTTQTAAVHERTTNLTLVHTSNTTHIIPNADNKTIHVQHQQISETIFHSTLAFLPSISTKNMNAPSPTTTTTTEIVTVDAVADSIDSTSPRNSYEKKESDKTQKLRAKYAEVAANPVILSQGI